MNKYRVLGKKGEGTFSEVLRGQSVKSGKQVAIKCMKHPFESLDQVNNLREVQALRRLSPHPNIVTLHEVLYDQPSGRLALVFELMECNIYELIRGRKTPLPEEQVKTYAFQLMRAVDHMHRHGIFHRDIKPENLLVSNNLLKLADFGSCRGSNSKRPFTEYISTRWYRAPECLLTDGHYGAEMDIWGIGCVLFEVLALFPLLPGANEADQLERIHKLLGTPGPELVERFRRIGSTHVDFSFTKYPPRADAIARMLPHVSPAATDLISRMLIYDPERRITARDALAHAWFADLHRAAAAAASAEEAVAAGIAEPATGGGAGGAAGGAGAAVSDGGIDKAKGPAVGPAPTATAMASSVPRVRVEGAAAASISVGPVGGGKRPGHDGAARDTTSPSKPSLSINIHTSAASPTTAAPTMPSPRYVNAAAVLAGAKAALAGASGSSSSLASGRAPLIGGLATSATPTKAAAAPGLTAAASWRVGYTASAAAAASAAGGSSAATSVQPPVRIQLSPLAAAAAALPSPPHRPTVTASPTLPPILSLLHSSATVPPAFPLQAIQQRQGLAQAPAAAAGSDAGGSSIAGAGPPPSLIRLRPLPQSSTAGVPLSAIAPSDRGPPASLLVGSSASLSSPGFQPKPSASSQPANGLFTLLPTRARPAVALSPVTSSPSSGSPHASPRAAPGRASSDVSSALRSSAVGSPTPGSSSPSPSPLRVGSLVAAKPAAADLAAKYLRTSPLHSGKPAEDAGRAVADVSGSGGLSVKAAAAAVPVRDGHRRGGVIVPRLSVLDGLGSPLAAGRAYGGSTDAGSGAATDRARAPPAAEGGSSGSRTAREATIPKGVTYLQHLRQRQAQYISPYAQPKGAVGAPAPVHVARR